MSDYAVLTGPGCRRKLTLQDGSVYDCATSPEDPNGYLEVESSEHQQELMHLVSLHYHHHGHPDHQDPTEPGFIYNTLLAPPGYEVGYTPHPDNKLKGL